MAADLAGRRFDNFTVDVAFGEFVVDVPDLIDGPDLLAFAGIPRTRVPAIPLELQIAEKVHAYTRIYGSGWRNTRVKDLVDLAHIARMSEMDGGKLCAALRRTFATRRAHEKPEALPPPPAKWAVPYRLLAETLGLPAELAEAHRIAGALVDPAIEGYVIGIWNPVAQRWHAPKRARLVCFQAALTVAGSRSHSRNALRLDCAALGRLDAASLNRFLGEP